MTEIEAKELAIKRVRNSPLHVLDVIHRYVQNHTRNGVWPYGSPTGEMRRYNLVDILRMRDDIVIHLCWQGINYEFLSVDLTPEGNAAIRFKGTHYGEYLTALAQRQGQRVAYTT